MARPVRLWVSVRGHHYVGILDSKLPRIRLRQCREIFPSFDGRTMAQRKRPSSNALTVTFKRFENYFHLTEREYETLLME